MKHDKRIPRSLSSAALKLSVLVRPRCRTAKARAHTYGCCSACFPLTSTCFSVPTVNKTASLLELSRSPCGKIPAICYGDEKTNAVVEPHHTLESGSRTASVFCLWTGLDIGEREASYACTTHFRLHRINENGNPRKPFPLSFSTSQSLVSVLVPPDKLGCKAARANLKTAPQLQHSTGWVGGNQVELSYGAPPGRAGGFRVTTPKPHSQKPLNPCL